MNSYRVCSLFLILFTFFILGCRPLICVRDLPTAHVDSAHLEEYNKEYEVFKSSAFGDLPGAFSVNNSGQANYSIPIEMPPGRNGVRPNIRLEYDSRLGNNIMGVGWQLSGLGRITRCPKFIKPNDINLQVMFDESDQLCLDSTPLVRVKTESCESNQLEYRLIEDSHKRICARPNPQGNILEFIVWEKTGYKKIYGSEKFNTYIDNLSTIWPLVKVEDEHGNYYEVSYEMMPWDVSDQKFNTTFLNRHVRGSNSSPLLRATSSVAYPQEIAYTKYNPKGETHSRPLAATKKIIFYYKDRDDNEFGYYGGYPFKKSKLLQSIAIFIADDENFREVNRYSIEYGQSKLSGRSILSTIEQCFRDICKPKTQFKWSSGKVGQIDFEVKNTAIEDNWLAPTLKVADLNGDSFHEILVFQEKTRMTNEWEKRNPLIFRHQQAEKKLSYIISFDERGEYNVTRSNLKVGLRANVCDCNGDGKDDLVFVGLNANGDLRENLTFAFSGDSLGSFDVRQSEISAAQAPVQINANNDGKSDLLVTRGGVNQIYLAGNHGHPPFTESNSLGAPGVPLIISDFSGDGITDYIFKNSENQYQMAFKNKASDLDEWAIKAITFEGGANGFAQGANLVVADINGDGRKDIIEHSINSGALSAWVNTKFTVTGNGADIRFTKLEANFRLATHEGYETYSMLDAVQITGNLIPLDLNKNQRDEILYRATFEVPGPNQHAKVWWYRIYLNSNNELAIEQLNLLPGTIGDNAVLDTNRDGLLDIVSAVGTHFFQTNGLESKNPVDKIIEIIEGRHQLDNETATYKIKYAMPGSSEEVYEAEQGCPVYRGVGCEVPKFALVTQVDEYKSSQHEPMTKKFRYIGSYSDAIQNKWLSFKTMVIDESLKNKTTSVEFLRPDYSQATPEYYWSTQKIKRIVREQTVNQNEMLKQEVKYYYSLQKNTYRNVEDTEPVYTSTPLLKNVGFTNSTKKGNSTNLIDYEIRGFGYDLYGQVTTNLSIKKHYPFRYDTGGPVGIEEIEDLYIAIGKAEYDSIIKKSAYNLSNYRNKLAKTYTCSNIRPNTNNNHASTIESLKQEAGQVLNSFTTELINGLSTCAHIDIDGKKQKYVRDVSGSSVTVTRQSFNSDDLGLSISYKYDIYGNVLYVDEEGLLNNGQSGGSVNTRIYYDDSEKMYPVKVVIDGDTVGSYRWNRLFGLPIYEQINGGRREIKLTSYNQYGLPVRESLTGNMGISFIYKNLTRGRNGTVSEIIVNSNLENPITFGVGSNNRISYTRYQSANNKNAFISYDYDNSNNLLRRKIRFGRETPVSEDYLYDQRNRIVSFKDMGGARVEYDYDGLVTSIKNTRGVKYEYLNNAAGLLKQISTKHNTINFNSRPFVGVAAIYTKSGLKQEKTFDGFNREVMSQGNIRGVSKFKYNDWNNPLEIARANQHVTRFTYSRPYHIVSRKDKKADFSDLIVWDYYTDSDGRLGKLKTAKSDSGIKETYEYDQFSLPKSYTLNIDSGNERFNFKSNFQYSVTGLLLNESYADENFNIRYNYNKSGSIDAIYFVDEEVEHRLVKIGFNDFGIMNGLHFGNKRSELSKFQNGKLTELKHLNNNIRFMWSSRREDIVQNIEYDELHNVSKISTKYMSRPYTDYSFRYDNYDQLLSYNRINYSENESDNKRFRYNSDYKMISEVDTSSNPHLRGAPNHVADVDLRLDQAGKLTAINNEVVITNQFGNPVRIGSDSFVYRPSGSKVLSRYRDTKHFTVGNAEYIYSGDGALVGTRYLVRMPSGLIVAEIQKLPGRPVDQRSIFYHHKDYLGSTLAISDYEGRLIYKAEFSATGHRKFSTTNNILKHALKGLSFTGHDVIKHRKFVDMKSRLYHPDLATFMSIDPVEVGEVKQYLQPFSYAMNNPVRYVDPFGLQTMDLEGMVIEGYIWPSTYNPQGMVIEGYIWPSTYNPQGAPNWFVSADDGQYRDWGRMTPVDGSVFTSQGDNSNYDWSQQAAGASEESTKESSRGEDFSWTEFATRDWFNADRSGLAIPLGYSASAILGAGSAGFEAGVGEGIFIDLQNLSNSRLYKKISIFGGVGAGYGGALSLGPEVGFSLAALSVPPSGGWAKSSTEFSLTGGFVGGKGVTGSVGFNFSGLSGAGFVGPSVGEFLGGFEGLRWTNTHYSPTLGYAVDQVVNAIESIPIVIVY